MPSSREAVATVQAWVSASRIFFSATSRKLPAGIYQGNVRVEADGELRDVPIELELFDFTLADENSMTAMVYYEGLQVELYQGRNLDAVYHRFAHRHALRA